MDFLNDRQKSHVKAQHVVFCVVDDPSDLFRVQTGVQGVQHPATAAHTKVNFQMPVTIPRQSGNARAMADFPIINGVGHLAGTLGDVGPVAAVDVSFDPTRNDLCVSMVFFSKFDQRGNRQVLTLHQSQHGRSPKRHCGACCFRLLCTIDR
jgi:hypothetical protein